VKKLRFDHKTHKIILDDDVFKGNCVVYNGICGKSASAPAPAPISDCAITISTFDICGKKYRFGEGCNKPHMQTDGYIETIDYNLTMLYCYSESGKYNLYYTLPRVGDVIHSISGLPSDIDCYFMLHTYEKKISNTKNINFPITYTMSFGLPVSGDGLCPDITHNKCYYLVLKGVPLDKLYKYYILPIEVTWLLMNNGVRREFKELDVKDIFR
jgi:hypothetical protein